MLRPLSSVVVARLTLDGELLDCNRGFSRLIGTRPDSAESPKKNRRTVDDLLINPSLHELRSLFRQAKPGLLFEGIMTLGDPRTACISLVGAIWCDQSSFLLVGEHDLDQIELLTASILELNNDLDESRRKLARQNLALQRSHDRVQALSLTDTLTNVCNRRALNERTAEELERAERSRQAFGLIMVDIDLFKRVNDDYGHDIGDLVLQSTAQCLERAVRPYDFLARYGGEEFVVILPDSDLATTTDVAERLCRLVGENHIPAIDRAITISLGATIWRPNDTTASLFHRVDKAMYAAKAAGRNCVRQHA